MIGVIETLSERNSRLWPHGAPVVFGENYRRLTSYNGDLLYLVAVVEETNRNTREILYKRLMFVSLCMAQVSPKITLENYGTRSG